MRTRCIKEYALLLCLTLFLSSSVQVLAQTTSPFVQEQIQSLNLKDIIEEFALAPHEDQLSIDKSTFQIDLLMPNGQNRTFKVVENDLLHPDFEKTFPEIHNYKIVAQNNPEVIGRVTVSPSGLLGTIFSENGLIGIVPVDRANPIEHRITLQSESNEGFSCDVKEDIKYDPPNAQEKTIIQNGSDIREYSIAIVTTGEYGQDNGGTPASGAAAVTQDVAAVEMVYERELAVNFSLLPPAVYTDPNTDPFTLANTPKAERTRRAAEEVDNSFPNSSSYDLGHVLHSLGVPEWEGGVAGRGALCNDLPLPTGGFNKALGWSSINSGTSIIGGLELFAHEIGHQFNMPHTWNGTGGVCTVANHSEFSAYEIGSGTTIMSYKDICQESHNTRQGFTNLTSYFHVNSLENAINHMINKAACATSTVSNNTIPTITANPCAVSHTIPKGTPFRLKGTGTDADGDQILYCWEQYDEDGPGEPTYGFIGVDAANNVNAPLFRSYPPQPSPERFFPDLSLVVTNQYLSPFEPLPQVARTLTMRLTGRDVRTGSRAVAIDEMTITVDNTGPFEVTSPNGAESFASGASVNVNWAIGGTSSYCSTVRIKLSIDGGMNYPYVLLASTANDGAESINLPSNLPDVTTARILVECADNDCVAFFDISNADFTITSDCDAALTNIFPDGGVNLPLNDPGLNLSQSILGTTIRQFDIDIPSSGGPSSSPAIELSQTDASCDELSSTRGYNIFDFQVAQTGTYTLYAAGGDLLIFGSIFQANSSNFDFANPCNTFIGSNIFNTSSGQEIRASRSYQLTEGTDYVFVAWQAVPINVVATWKLEGVGAIASDYTPPGSDYDYTYAAVNTSTGLIDVVNANADFTSLPSGTYEVFGVSYYSGSGPNPPQVTPSSWVGQSIGAVVNTDCAYFSDNYRLVEVTGSSSTPSISIAPTDANKSEGDSGNTPFVFTVTRSGDTSMPSDITYSVSGTGSSPAESTDFGGNFPSGAVNFLANEMSKDITINVTGDANDEPDEDFQVTIAIGNNGTLGNAVATGTILNDDTAGPTAETLDFDGNDDYVDLPDNLTASITNFTFEAWVNPTRGSTWERVMDFGNDLTTYMFLTPNAFNGTPRFAITNGGPVGEQVISAPDPAPIGQWQHYAVTIDASTNTGKFYIDGLLVAENPNMTLNPSILGNLTNNYLGNSNFPADPELQGQLDEVRIWSIVRTEEEINCTINDELTGSEAGLIAYYDFNEGVAGGNNLSETTLTDRAPNNEDGTLINFALTGNASNWVSPGHPLLTPARSIDFDGIDDYVDCGTILPVSYTKEAWIKLDPNNSSNGDNIISGGVSTGQHAFFLFNSLGTKRVFAGHNGVYGAVSDPNGVPAGWVHYALSYDATSQDMILYKNGIEVSSTTIAPATGNNQVYVGWFDGDVNYFDGKFDEVRIWDGARSATEIFDNYQRELTGTESGLVTYYNFNQGVPAGDNTTETTATDLSSAGNNGTLTNFTLMGCSSNWVGDNPNLGPAVPPVSCPPTLSVQGTVNTETYEAQNEITSDGTVPAGNDVIFTAPETTLEPNFEVEFGGLLEVLQTGCVPLKEDDNSQGQ